MTLFRFSLAALPFGGLLSDGCGAPAPLPAVEAGPLRLRAVWSMDRATGRLVCRWVAEPTEPAPRQARSPAVADGLRRDHRPAPGAEGPRRTAWRFRQAA
ncbi:hypothetical protein MMB17_17680 [Methylobacterium organophilum]|uniref:hypothetical protein n=1 Tax=Methylobacterium organophilum TaxID=410 RepID=UPI001F12AB06|nr:hypothetical protein [Methylobacterium organophilum]UMY16510.1 hypothetical protein MMB17_17680 [Methylobacterium organophilum]